MKIKKKKKYESNRVTIVSEVSQFPEKVDYLVLCIKPHDVEKIASNLDVSIGDNTTIISILAGVKIKDLQSKLGDKAPVVRAMPNIAAVVGKAASVLSHSKELSEAKKKDVELLFSAIGEAYWGEEKYMDAVTGLSGSGPAYIYMVIEALTDGGVKMGLPRNIAAPLAVQTVLGAASMVKETGLHPAVLKDQVTTPAGTTISALAELEERGLRSMFLKAVEKATKRSEKLGKN